MKIAGKLSALPVFAASKIILDYVNLMRIIDDVNHVAIISYGRYWYLLGIIW